MDPQRTPPLFVETQRFRQPVLWALLLGGAGVVGVGLLAQGGDTDPAALPGLLLTGAILVLVLVFFGWVRLETRLDHEGVRFRFFPFHRKERSIPWDQVERAWVRSYRPIPEFGGWGLRLGRGGRAYTVSGTTGLQLVLRDGQHILLGTRQDPRLRVALSGLTGRGIVATGPPPHS